MRFTRIEEGSGYCGRYLKQVAVHRTRVNHLPHLLLSVVTLGIWLIKWIPAAAEVHHWKCLECGETVYKIMS